MRRSNNLGDRPTRSTTCQWPVDLWGTRDLVTGVASRTAYMCMQPSVDNDKDRHFGIALCSIHRDSLIGYVHHSIVSGTVDPPRLDEIAMALIEASQGLKMRELAQDELTGWGDAVDDEIVRRLKQDDVNGRVRAAFDDYGEERIATIWSASNEDWWMPGRVTQ